MSVSRHAYRHALQSTPSRLDYVWISDELLSSTFKRFVNGQRRYGSRVPGPLEASKRLAKRRNTALAVAGSPFDPTAEVAHLFGANGKGHVRQWDDSPWSSRWPEPLEVFSYSDQPPATPSPSFLVHPKASGLAYFDTTESTSNPAAAGRSTFASSLAGCETTQDVKEAMEWHQIDLRKEPEHSRMIFGHFYQLVSTTNTPSAIHNMIDFLNDTSLNISGVGNYAELFDRLSSPSLDASLKTIFIHVATKAIGLGLVPITETCRLLQLLPTALSGRGQSLSKSQTVRAFQDIWEALQSCSVFKLHEVYHDLLEPWVDQLMSLYDAPYLDLAKDILVAYYESMRTVAHSMSTRVLQVLSSRGALDNDTFEAFLDRPLMFGDQASLNFARDIIVTHHRYEQSPSKLIANVLLKYIVHKNWAVDHTRKSLEILPDLLRQLNPDLAVSYIVMMTESLAFTTDREPLRAPAFKTLRTCLMHINKPAILSSGVWAELKEVDSFKASKGLRAALRIWAWSALRTMPHRRRIQSTPVHLHSKNVEATGISILKLFDSVTTSIVWQFHGNKTELMPKLITGLQQLQVPSNQVLRKIYTLLSHRQIRNASTLQSFRKLEEGSITLEQTALQQHLFNSTKSYLLSSHIRVIENVDITSPHFIQNMIEMIEKDNRNIRQIIFLISFHTPLKIALAMASTRNVGIPPPKTKRVRTIMRLEAKGKQLYLEPQACVSFIHLLAASIAASDKVSPRAALNLVSQLYRYLVVHNGPVQPSFARALYHCGITRFSQKGLYISKAQAGYVMQVVRRHEEPEAVRGLLNGSFFENVR